MSDALVRLVSVEPSFCPHEEQAQRALTLVKGFLQAEAVSFTVSENVQFVDAGANWEGVLCPSCGADAESWWSEAMSEASARQFESLVVTAPCCGQVTSLEKLRYGWPVGFARFVIEARNSRAAALTVSQVSQLEAVLGTRIRQIPAHV